jgi:hypothetical protein
MLRTRAEDNRYRTFRDSVCGRPIAFSIIPSTPLKSRMSSPGGGTGAGNGALKECEMKAIARRLRQLEAAIASAADPNCAAR